MIRQLDPTLLFDLLFVAEGFKPEFVKKVDPCAGTLEVQLSPVPPDPPAPKTLFQGHVLDPEGRPVMGAVVNIHRYWFSGDTWSSRSPEGSDPLGISDRQGRFRIRHTQPLEKVTAKVEACGLAPMYFREIPVDDKPTELRMIRGATVKGRLTHDGESVADVSIGVVQTDRSAGKFLGEFTIGTDRQGGFLLPNITPGFEYVVYGEMGTLRGIGAVPVRTLEITADEEVIDVGELKVIPGLQLGGQVVLSNGAPLPENTRFTISRQKAWDSLVITLDASGRFVARDLPSEVYSITTRVRGYHLADRNPNLDPVNRRLHGRLEHDLENFIILLEPGEAPRAPWDDELEMRRLWKRIELLPEMPLQGARRE